MDAVKLSPPDARDYPVSMVADVGADIPADFEVWQPPVENQGSTGNCVAQSLANIMECIAHQYEEEHKDYSVGYIYGNSRNTARTGMYPREACDIIIKDGDVHRSLWECLEENPYTKQIWKEQVDDELKAKARKAAAYIRINNKEELQTFMLKYKLPVMLIAQTKNFAETSSDGYHATVCYGWISEETYNANPDKYNDYRENDYEDLLFTNSWGKSYHNNGRGTCKSWRMEEMWGIVPMDKIKLKDIEKHWAKKDIEYLIDLGIVKGYEDNTYRPDNGITRGEMAAMLARIMRTIKGE